MSYTMTIDEPKEAAWFNETRRDMSPSELGALFVAFLRQRLADKIRRKEFVHGTANANKSRPSFLEACRACPVDVNFNELIPPRSKRVGRAHPLDFSRLFADEV